MAKDYIAESRDRFPSASEQFHANNAAMAECFDLLVYFYTTPDAMAWLKSPQGRFGGLCALELFVSDRAGEVLTALRQLADGAYI